MSKVLFLLSLILFLSCSNDSTPYSSGTDSDNYVRGSVISKDRDPLSDSKLYLYKTENENGSIKKIIVDSSFSDNSGNWEFVCGDGMYSLLSEGDRENSPAIINFSIDKRDSDNLKITHSASSKSIVGRVLLNDSSEDVTVSTPFSKPVKVDVNGEYELKSVYTGDCEVIFSNSSDSYVCAVKLSSGDSVVYFQDINLEENNSDNGSIYNVNLILPVQYADSEVPDYYEGKSFDGVEYITYKDSEPEVVDVTGNKKLILADFEYEEYKLPMHDNYTNSGFNAFWQYYILADDLNTSFDGYYTNGYSGRGFYTEFFYGDSTISTGGSFTIYFGSLEPSDEYKNYADLSKVTSLNFALKGSGVIKVMIQDSASVISAGGVFSQFQKIIYPTLEWQQYSISIDSLLCSPELDTAYLGLHREGALEKVKYINFLTVATPGDSMFFTIDNVSLSGVNLGDL